jgi:hypothetical protein
MKDKTLTPTEVMELARYHLEQARIHTLRVLELSSTID